MPKSEHKCQFQITMCRKAEEKKLGPGALMIENMRKQGKPVTPWVEKLAASMDKMQKEGGEMGEVHPFFLLYWSQPNYKYSWPSCERHYSISLRHGAVSYRVLLHNFMIFESTWKNPGNLSLIDPLNSIMSVTAKHVITLAHYLTGYYITLFCISIFTVQRKPDPKFFIPQSSNKLWGPRKEDKCA